MSMDHTDCKSEILPIMDAMEAISGKWKLMILLSIAKGNSRFKQIERSIPRLSGKVLSKELKDLEQNDLVKRTVYDEYPVRVEYNTTEHSKSLKPLFHELINWGQHHRQRIKVKHQDVTNDL